MWIDVKIPYEPGRKLAYAYNRAMETSKAEWVLLLDHDVFLCNPYWYDICLRAIEKLNDTDAGLIVCMTSGPRQKLLQRVSLVQPSSIEESIILAKTIYDQYGAKLKPVTTTVTGFFMLVKRQVWEKVMFVKQRRGVGRVDIDFSKRLLERGFTIWLMMGLYVYHRRGMRKLKW